MDHPPIPGTPSQAGDLAVGDLAAGAADRFNRRHAIENLIGGGVIALPFSTQSSGGGGEEGNEVEFVILADGEKVPSGIDLGGPDQFELLVTLVTDPAIRKDARTVDDSTNRSMAGSRFIDASCQFFPITNIEGSILDLTAEAPQFIEVTGQLSNLANLQRLLADESGSDSLCRIAEQVRFQLVIGDCGGPVRFRSWSGSSAQ